LSVLVPPDVPETSRRMRGAEREHSSEA